MKTNIRIEFDEHMNPTIIDYENGVRADVLYDERGRYWNVSHTVNGERVDQFPDSIRDLWNVFRAAQNR